MTTEITMSQIYWNKSLKNFFFRTQAEETFEEVMECIAVGDKENALDQITEFYDNLDDCEEDFYNLSADEIIQMIGLPVEYEEDEED